MDTVFAPLGPLFGRSTNGHLPLPPIDPQVVSFSDQGLSDFSEYWRTIDQEKAMLRDRRFSLVFVSLVIPSVDGAGLAEENPEAKWLSDHAGEIEREYRGQWLLLRGNQLLRHSAEFAEIRGYISEKGIQSPFLYFVTENSEADFIA